MHVAAFIASIGVLLGVIGPWITLGKYGSKSGIHFNHGLIMLVPVAVMIMASFYALILRRTRRPVRWELVVAYMVMGVFMAGYALWVKNTLELQVADIADRVRISVDTLIGWGITSIPWTAGAVALAGGMAFLMPGDVGGEDESTERRRLG